MTESRLIKKDDSIDEFKAPKDPVAKRAAFSLYMRK
jgi:hypothetical protein